MSEEILNYLLIDNKKDVKVQAEETFRILKTFSLFNLGNSKDKLNETKTRLEIDVEQFAHDIKAGKSIGGKDGALSSLIKQLTEAALAAEIDSHLTQDLS